MIWPGYFGNPNKHFDPNKVESTSVVQPQINLINGQKTSFSA